MQQQRETKQGEGGQDTPRQREDQRNSDQPNSGDGLRNAGLGGSEIPDWATGRLKLRHWRQLHDESGIDEEVIRERGYRSVTAGQARDLGFSRGQCREGLLLPVCGTDGRRSLFVLRPDEPREKEDKVLKYEFPSGEPTRLDCPPRCKANLGDPSIPLWITEGQKKADAMASHGLCSVALLGVWNFKGKNGHGGVTLLADWDYVAVNDRDVFVVFDSDIATKPQVEAALLRLREHLQRRGARVQVVYLPSTDGRKVGVDDYLLHHSVPEFKALLQEPRPKPQPVAPLIEMVDDAPQVITRPLALIDGQAYAVVWPHIRTTLTETMERGEVVKHDPPIVRTRREVHVLRSDGVLFGPAGSLPLAKLGMEFQVTSIPKAAVLWRAPGVRAYMAGYRADPLDVFLRIVKVVDRFIDFDRSLADQDTTCELIACYIIATWFTDAYTIVGFLWVHGESGSGKTKLAQIVCEIAHLGEELGSGSTYASVRDLSDLGACLLFDDAETISHVGLWDPDKRNLLLEGNHRGATITVKEPDLNGSWRTRYVNIFCPRLFTSIADPDPVLSSRCVVVPMVRTADKEKGNSSVKDYDLWPCDRQQLVDDAWALALANLPKLQQHERSVGRSVSLIGRNLDPWRGLLAVAHWLSDQARQVGNKRLETLYDRMVALGTSYQSERSTLESMDLGKVVVRALVAVAAPSAPYAPSSRMKAPIRVSVERVTRAARELAEREDLFLAGEEEISARRVGKLLTKLRIQAAPKKSGEGRQRVTSLAELDKIARAYGLPPVIGGSRDDKSGGHQEEMGQTG